MKKATSLNLGRFVLTMMALILVTSSLNAQTLIISEYIEGSSNNKAIELYNATDTEIDLSTVEMYRANNGSATWQDTLSLSGALPAGGFYLIANPSADDALLDKADTTSTITFYNGDDALALAVGGSIIDVIGVLGEDPGSAWDVAGVTEATNEQTLVRKATVTAGNTDWAASAGTNATDSEWEVRDRNDFSNFGLPTNAVNITFRVNMATALDTVNGDSYTVHINGAIKGANPGQTLLGGETISWDANATATLENVGGDYWEGTYQLAAGDTLLYKYRYFNTATEGSDDENGFATTNNPAGWDTRGLVASADTVLDLAFYNDRGDNPEPGTIQPWATDDDSVAIWFRVNVGILVQEEKFDPMTDSIQVRGGQAPLTWDAATGVVLAPEAEAGGDNVFYSGVGYFPKDSLSTFTPDGRPEGTIKYKFYAYGPNTEAGWESSADRFFTATSNDTTIHGLNFNMTPPTNAVIVNTNLNFAVNVGILEGLGFFNAGVGDSVFVRGTFNGWGQEAMAFNGFTQNWERNSLPFTGAVESEVEYKFYVLWDESRDDEQSPNFLEGITFNESGWEEPASTGGGNRVLVVQDSETQDPVLENYNGADPRGLITTQTADGGSVEVTFSIDMTAAESDVTPFDPATDSLYIVFDQPFFNLTQGYTNGDDAINQALTPEEIEGRRFTDGDGDGVYTLTLPLQLPTLNVFGFRVGYGNPFTTGESIRFNGAGFDSGRRYYQFIQPQVDGSGNVTFPSTFAFNQLTWSAEDLTVEPVPNYTATSNEEDITEVASQFRLEQNYPNPFNPTTTISFNLPNASEVNLSVFNILGQRVATLATGKFTAGAHAVNFDAANLASGVYIYRIEAGNFVEQRLMTLIK